MVRHSNTGPQERERPHHIVSPKNAGARSTADMHARSLEHTVAQVVHSFVSTLSISGDESDLTVEDGGSYCPVWYSSKQVKSEYHDPKQGTKFIRARNRSYEARFTATGEHNKEMPYSASGNSPSPWKNPAAWEMFTDNKNRSRNTQYPSPPGIV